MVGEWGDGGWERGVMVGWRGVMVGGRGGGREG